MKMAEMRYTPEQIGMALTTERLNGVCYFSICGVGETTIQPQIEDIVYHIMKHWHYVNVTTNGTVDKQTDRILERNRDSIDRLYFVFSFHYVEIVRLNLLEKFFEYIQKAKNVGESFMMQINLCDEYVPHLDEIKRLCIKNVGAMPRVAAT